MAIQRLLLSAVLLVSVWCCLAQAEKTLSRQKRAYIENSCNGRVVTTTVPEGELYPRRYPRRDSGYRRGTCKWNVQAGEGQVINIDLHYITARCRRGDFLRIVDGNGNVIVSKCDESAQSYVTVSNSMLVYFKARASNRRMNGFYLEYFFSDPGTPSSNACIHPGLSFTDETGTGQTNGFEDDGQGAYGHNSDCRWKIDVGGENNALLAFDRFSVEYEYNCGFDWMDVYDGPDLDARRIARYCGTGSVPDIKSTGSALFIHFKSDHNIARNGFKFSWSTLVPGTPNDGSELGCGDDVNEVNGLEGELTSPNYGSAYPPESECAHRITTAPDTVMLIKIEEMDIEHGRNCEYDSLTIFDGENSDAPMLYDGGLCGDLIPNIPISTGNIVYVVFESDGTREGNGFKLTWEQRRAEEIQGEPCEESGQVISMEEGVIESPGFNGGGYADNADCRWRIRAKEGGQVVVRWNLIDIEYESGCNYDVLEVHDGATLDAKVVEAYCGRLSTAPPVKSSGQDLLIRFTSDGGVVDKGFSLNFVTLEADTPDDGSAPGCGGTAAQLTTGSYSFTSPGYDGTSTYGGSAACAWKITATEGTHIRITFSNMDLEDLEGCAADSIKVHNGPLSTSPLRSKKCGSEDYSVYVSSNQAYVTFESDATGSGTGFQAVWEEVEPEPAQCGVPDPQYPITSKSLEDAKIIGGVEANEHSLPWQILLERNGGFTCGGSVISPEWILTAAHCVTESGYTVVAGVHDQTKTESSQQRRSVSRIIIHENYGNFDNDIALLKLSSPLELNEFVKPVCIGQASVPPNTECLTSGWGVTDAGRVSNKLMQVYLPVLSHSQCIQYLGGSTFTDNMICAGLHQGGVDACSGDSGGPLVCQTSDSDAWVLHGITSWGYGCGDPRSPGVWAKASNYQSWIQDKTEGAGIFLD